MNSLCHNFFSINSKKGIDSGQLHNINSGRGRVVKATD